MPRPMLSDLTQRGPGFWCGCQGGLPRLLADRAVAEARRVLARVGDGRGAAFVVPLRTAGPTAPGIALAEALDEFVGGWR